MRQTKAKLIGKIASQKDSPSLHAGYYFFNSICDMIKEKDKRLGPTDLKLLLVGE